MLTVPRPRGSLSSIRRHRGKGLPGAAESCLVIRYCKLPLGSTDRRACALPFRSIRVRPGCAPQSCLLFASPLPSSLLRKNPIPLHLPRTWRRRPVRRNASPGNRRSPHRPSMGWFASKSPKAFIVPWLARASASWTARAMEGPAVAQRNRLRATAAAASALAH